jgi:hypothetical protein
MSSNLARSCVSAERDYGTPPESLAGSRFVTRFLSTRGADEECGGRTASHYGVDVSVAPHSEDAGGASPAGDCQDRDRAKGRTEVTGRNDHSDKCGEDGKLRHAWFRQRDEIRQVRRQPGV